MCLLYVYPIENSSSYPDIGLGLPPPHATLGLLYPVCLCTQCLRNPSSCSTQGNHLIRFLSGASAPSLPRSWGEIMSSLFLAHISGCTFSDRCAISGPGDLKFHPPPPPHGRDSALVSLGSPVPWGTLKGGLERVQFFTTNGGTAHSWRAALGGLFSEGGSDPDYSSQALSNRPGEVAVCSA